MRRSSAWVVVLKLASGVTLFKIPFQNPSKQFMFGADYQWFMRIHTMFLIIELP